MSNHEAALDRVPDPRLREALSAFLLAIYLDEAMKESK